MTQEAPTEELFLSLQEIQAAIESRRTMGWRFDSMQKFMRSVVAPERYLVKFVRSESPLPATVVRDYPNVDLYQAEAAFLVEDGWRVVSTTNQSQQVSGLAVLLFGWLSLLSKPPQHIIVTYGR